MWTFITLLPLYLLQLSSSYAVIPTEDKFGSFPPFKTVRASARVISSNLTLYRNLPLTPPFSTLHTPTSDLSLLTKGYIFFQLYPWPEQIRYGPQIFDETGQLVFFANQAGDLASFGNHGAAPCDYLGTTGTHLCAARLELHRPRKDGRQEGYKVINTNTYEPQAKEYGLAGTLTNWPDGHEFNMLPGGRSFLVPVYEPMKVDLRAYNGPKRGYVRNACMQEIDVQTGDCIFQWCFLDDHELWETYVYMLSNGVNVTHAIAGNGTKDRPWDFVHMNAIDKNEENDYLVSLRHLNQVLKIAGPQSAHNVEPGTVLWRLGGKRNEFDTGDLTFARQHHCRYVLDKG